MYWPRLFCTAIVLSGLLAFRLNVFSQQGNNPIISSREEISQDMSLAPCNDKERLTAVKALFVNMGVSDEELSVNKLDGVENLVVSKQGKSQDTIVVGAHYDKTHEGCGAIDNWSGIVALAHIYKSLKNIPLDKSLIFVAFGKEEKGLLGSKAMVRRIKKEEVNQYCAMVNIDSLGMANPQVIVDLSSEPLVNRAVALAQRMKMPFNKVTVPGAGSDSVSFIDKKIPAITISGIANGWGEVLHTNNDQVLKVDSTSVYLGYRLALALVAELNNHPCQISREKAKS